ncbi:alanyl (membrane) aminopeptidase-like b [Centropristis striata]|uniref:alanyl (membrane) aminopeptidase-like b n=1 Tax=Centropristis striata TaxID=184440 RepID=UPI0027E0255C|nr:alanyl (membrane) aminopeptidase-like b [Centropristis striata]
MSKNAVISKAFAAAFAILTVSVIVGIVGMIIYYNKEISTMNPTVRPIITSTTVAPPPKTRLPQNVIPHSYKVFLQPHLYTRIIEKINVTSPNQTYVFTGNSTVNFHCVNVTRNIYLYSLDLKISKAVVMDEDKNKMIPVTAVNNTNTVHNFLEIKLNKDLEVGGNYSLFLAFEGEMLNVPDSLYVSTYIEGVPASEDDTNTERFLAATNLQPTNARRLFPCFDEPELKAKFNVTIIHRINTIALGNAERKDSLIIDDDWIYTSFHPTPVMSTYLFAFTVSEFKDSTPSSHERVEINTYARPEAVKAGHTQYAANITGKILKFFEDYFGIEYEQKKLDQIALPDLYPLAMENWGLITYQEGSLLFEEGVSSLLHKEDIANLIAHELAHQWFGNLVTMKWWNEIWLNEGFANYMSVLAIDAVEPTFKLKDIYIMFTLHTAFEQDALASSHPLSPSQQEVQDSDEIHEMFDSITYCKGEAVLRMLVDIVDERVFIKGIRSYLSDFKFKNTDQNDLWEYIQKAEHMDGGHTEVAKVMNTWTKQIGYPVITINTTTGEVYQKHFLFNESSESSLWWYVHIRVMSETSKPTFVWLESRETVKKDEFISKSEEWILANINCTGYYRVNYNPENWERLLTQLETKPDRIPLMNRGQLVDDAFNLARGKLVEVTLALKSTRFLRNETEFIPWESAVRNLEYFVLMFDRSEVYGPMQAYLREQVTGLYGFFNNYTDNWQVPKDHSLQHNQILAIQVACSNGLPECLKMVTRMYSQWMHTNGTNRIHPNLRSVIYCQAVAAGGREEWEFAWTKYQNSSDTSEKDQLREALACTKKIWLLNRYLEYTLNPEKIRLMDVTSTINSIARNVAGQALAWNFIRAHWEYVNQWDAATLIEGVTSRFSTQFELEELQRFAKDYDLRAATRAVEQAIEQTQVNIQWVGKNKDIILEWFERETAK